MEYGVEDVIITAQLAVTASDKNKVTCQCPQETARKAGTHARLCIARDLHGEVIIEMEQAIRSDAVRMLRTAGADYLLARSNSSSSYVHGVE